MPRNNTVTLDPRGRALVLRTLNACERSKKLLQSSSDLLRRSHGTQERLRLATTVSASGRAYTAPRLSYQQLQHDFNQNGFDFLMLDLDTAITFIRRAAQPQVNAATRLRNVKNARRAYDSVARLRKRFSFNSEQQNALEKKQLNVREILTPLEDAFHR